MKRVAFFFMSATFLVLQSCQPKATKTDAPIEEIKVVGADADAHECKGSAGYTWSELNQNCIRIFEDGVQMTAVDSSLDQSLAAYIVFNADSSKGELFIPNVSNSVLVAKTGALTWADSTYQLMISNKHLVIKNDAVTLYQSQ